MLGFEMNNANIFFEHLIDYGSNHYDHFTRFNRSSKYENELEYRNVVRGVHSIFSLEEKGVRLVFEARMPKRVSTKTIRKFFDIHNEVISNKVGIKMIWSDPTNNSESTKVSMFHEFPLKQTDLTFKNLIKSLTSSMNEMILAEISVEL